MAYRDVVLADSPSAYWRLADLSDETGRGHALAVPPPVTTYSDYYLDASASWPGGFAVTGYATSNAVDRRADSGSPTGHRFQMTNTTIDGSKAQGWLDVNCRTTMTLSFWRRIYSESNYDWAAFYVDGVRQYRTSGVDTGWQAMSYTLGAGSHRLMWEYLKDSIVSEGFDNHYFTGIRIKDYYENTTTYYDGIAWEGALLGNEPASGRLFNGGNRRLQRGDHADFNRKTYSIEFWIKPSAPTGGWRNILVKGSGGIPGRAPGIWLHPNDLFLHFMHESNDGTGQTGVSQTRALTQDRWHHVVCTSTGDAGTMAVWIDGVLDAQFVHGATLLTNTLPFEVSLNGVSIGVLDEVAYYPTVLSPDRIRAHHEMGRVSGLRGYERTVAQDRPVAYWSRLVAARTPQVFDRTRNSATLEFGPAAISGLVTWLNAERWKDTIADGATLGGGIGAADSYGTTAWTPQGNGGVYRRSGTNGRAYFETTSAGDGLRWNQNVSGAATVFYVARMKGTANARLLSGLNNNWLLGYHGGNEGQGYFEVWLYGEGSLQGARPATTNLRAYSMRTGASPVPMWQDYSLLTPISGRTGGVGPNGLTTTGYLGGSEYSNGEIYEVIVYNRALTDTEMAAVHGYLGSKYGGALTGLDLPAPGPVRDDASSVSVALSRSWGSAADAPRLRLSGDMTGECWIYPTSFNGRSNILQKTDYWHEFALTLETEGGINFYWGSGAATNQYNALYTGAGRIPLNTWTHLAFRRQGPDFTAWFLNGEIAAMGRHRIDDAASGLKVGSGGTFYTGATGTGPFTVGHGYTGSPYYGRIAEIALYPYALTQAQIRAHYRAGAAGFSTPGHGGYGA